MTKFLNISVDNTLGGNSPSDVTVSSQKAVKEYVDAHSGGGGSVAIDNNSITRNSSLQIQTVGVIDSNNVTNAVKTWTGTRSQYDAILSKDANTEYLCTDTGEMYLGTVKIGGDASLTILEALYPVGAVYITTANTCPLSVLMSGSTWTLISSGVVTSVDTNVPVKGNGTSLGFTDGTHFAGIREGTSAWVSASGAYGVSVGTASGTTKNFTNNVALGITTNASKSGIVGTVTRATLSVNIFERTA